MNARVFLLFVAVLTTGCFVRNAAEPRFFRPDSALLHDAHDGASVAPSAAPAVRFRAVDGASYLRERVVWRASEIEYGFYEQRRWRELPTSYVAVAVETALRKAGRVRLSDDMRAPALRVDVSAFDEVLAPTHVAVVEGGATLRNRNGEVLLDRAFRAETPIAGDDPAAMARAMGNALDAVATEIADAVAIAVAEPQRSVHPTQHGKRPRAPKPH